MLLIFKIKRRRCLGPLLQPQPTGQEMLLCCRQVGEGLGLPAPSSAHSMRLCITWGCRVHLALPAPHPCESAPLLKLQQTHKSLPGGPRSLEPRVQELAFIASDLIRSESAGSDCCITAQTSICFPPAPPALDTHTAMPAARPPFHPPASSPGEAH